MKKKLTAIAATIILFVTITFGCTPPPTAWAYSKPSNFTSLAYQAGWKPAELRTLSCVITRESGWNRFAHNPLDPGMGSYGWTQLNMTRGTYGTFTYYGRYFGYNVKNLYVPSTNLKVAKIMSNRSIKIYGDKWRPWRPLGRCA